MADSTTTNLLLTKPEVGASTDTWGTKINTDLDTIDGVFKNDGTGTAVNGTANGVLYINATKKQVAGSALVFDGTNFGLGATPSTFTGLGAKVFESDGGATAYRGATSGVEQYTNTYFNGGFLYKASGYATRFATASGAYAWYTAPSGSANAAITFTQAMTLNANGVLALQGASTSATGVGITFPATQSASSDANTLDDYEEGTWTPTFNVASGTPSGTATYVKIGKQVTLCFTNNTGSITTVAGTSTITGMPFAINANAGTVGAVGACSDTASTSALALYKPSLGADQMYFDKTLTAVGGFGFTVTYITT